ncbi:nuclear transport factor 2 family protein [Amycolatopsis benzoatilytica]|uniref:nuclear transport factor 2 family protein n=1 Tax=Amycolatopsis benzoatilytica TaxID=346045 RepID=UPI00035F6361|nr:nuclear transport factor 2 family protein [Amycolatopsis benzoatilytica]
MTEIEELIARAEIGAVLARYAHAIDRGDRRLARTCYHADAIDNHGRINGSVDDVFAFFESYGANLRGTYHFLGVPLIVVGAGGDPGRAMAETYCLYRRELLDPEAEVLMQGLRYFDVFERRAEAWRIAHRTVLLDWEQRGAGAPGVPAPPSWTRGGRGEADVAWPITEHLARAEGLRR